jgi:hypothetical protein
MEMVAQGLAKRIEQMYDQGMTIELRDLLPAADPVAGVAFFMGWLRRVDMLALTPEEQLALAGQIEAAKGTMAAAQARAVAEFDAAQRVEHVQRGGRPETAGRSVGSQVGLALRTSPSRGDAFGRMAVVLTDQMPHTMRALEEGRIGEYAASVMVSATSGLPSELREEIDERLAGPDSTDGLVEPGQIALETMTPRQIAGACSRLAAELDAAAVVARNARAAAGRGVCVRPAPDGQAYLTVQGPMVEVVGAYAALTRDTDRVCSGADEAESADGRGRGAVMADLALRRLSGRAVDEPQPLTINLVMTDRSLTGLGDGRRSVDEPVRVAGHGHLPAGQVRALLADPAVDARVRRLFTTPSGRDLVAMESRARHFPIGLRTMIRLRDDVCATPWCDAPVRHDDHVTAHSAGGSTGFHTGSGLCARCNLVKEDPGWSVSVTGRGAADRVTVTRAPTGTLQRSQAPPVMGPGWRSPDPPREEIEEWFGPEHMAVIEARAQWESEPA